MEEDFSPHQVAAKQQPHDEQGHFAPKLDTPPASSTSSFSRLLNKTASVSNTNDNNTLIDVHVNNPLKRIIELLSDIKKQKAFSFTLKGSLGIMGVALALSLFGVFGGSKMLCDKGTQTQVGMLKQLASTNEEKSNVPVINGVINYYNNFFVNKTQPLRKRIVLLKSNLSTVFLPYSKDVGYEKYLNHQVYITGQYDSCSQVLKPNSQTDIEEY